MNSAPCRRMAIFALPLLLLAALATVGPTATQAEECGPLPSWTEGPRKQAILEFVAAVTDTKSPDFVPPAERLAVFDNDGTLWVEQPVYTQVQFAFDRIHAMAAQHPEWKNEQPFKAVLENDLEALVAGGKEGLLEIMAVSHTGMTTEAFAGIVEAWLEKARHPRFKRPYTACVYQPMLELLTFLRAKGFKTYIVSGGGVEFMRPFTQDAYGIPPEQVIGSSIKTEFKIVDGKPVLLRKPEIFFIDDKETKPVGINTFIGRRPIAAFGNSDGDVAMLQWTLAGKGRSLAMIVHHTDAEREYAYDRDSHIGRLVKGLDDAKKWGWHLIDMKKDWTRILPATE